MRTGRKQKVNSDKIQKDHSSKVKQEMNTTKTEHHSTPPSRDCSRYPRLNRVTPAKVRDQSLIKNVFSRDPGRLLGSITLPIHEVLKATTPVVDRQQASNSVHWPTINDPGGWRGSGGGDQWTGHNGLDLRNVGSWVDSHSPGELELDGHRIDHFGNGERTDESGC